MNTDFLRMSKNFAAENCRAKNAKKNEGWKLFSFAAFAFFARHLKNHVAARAQMWNVAANMSEFKYACPVCGQHMQCDSSQTGSVTDCPTCFQKIIVPQAPADADQKLILTGTKVSDHSTRRIPTVHPQPPTPTPAKGFPGALVVGIILVFISTVTAVIYHGTVFKTKSSDATPRSDIIAGPRPVDGFEKRDSGVPPASGTNWALNLNAMKIPDAAAAGRVHGQDFIIARASFSNGTLTLRDDTRGPTIFGVIINFNDALPEALSGQTINVTTNANTAAHVTLHWQNDADFGNENFDNGYALRLEFGALTNGHLPGKIYLCTPDAEKSYLAGTFNADARKPKPEKPQP
jgi:DNA-directed RNA polymerase subunit RPC12/RpoP